MEWAPTASRLGLQWEVMTRKPSQLLYNKQNRGRNQNGTVPIPNPKKTTPLPPPTQQSTLTAVCIVFAHLFFPSIIIPRYQKQNKNHFHTNIPKLNQNNNQYHNTTNKLQQPIRKLTQTTTTDTKPTQPNTITGTKHNPNNE